MIRNEYPRHRRRALILLGGAGLALGIDACGSGTSTLQRQTADPSGTLPAAIAKGCVYPSASAQTTALPSAGGVTGTISLAAFSQASSVCLTTTVATGADATLLEATASEANAAVRASSQRRSTQASAAGPILEVSLFDAFSGKATITGVTLNVPGLPDGTYPATVTTDQLGATVVTNYTLVVHDGVATTGGGIFGSPIEPDGTGILTVYPIGTVLPSPSPTSSASPSASPSASAAPTATPTTTPTSIPTLVPTATPTATPNPATFTASITLTPAACVQFPSSGGSQTYTITPSVVPPPGFSYIYGYSGFSFPGATLYAGAYGQEFAGVATSSATLTVAPAYGAGAGVEVALFLQAPTGSPFYGAVNEVYDASGNPDQISEPWYEGVETCATSSGTVRRRP